jgi:hypothetical protein
MKRFLVYESMVFAFRGKTEFAAAGQHGQSMSDVDSIADIRLNNKGHAFPHDAGMSDYTGLASEHTHTHTLTSTHTHIYRTSTVGESMEIRKPGTASVQEPQNPGTQQNTSKRDLNSLHIAKTAGLSLIKDLPLHLGTHKMGWSEETCGGNIDPGSSMVFVRDPLAHVYSQWIHCHANLDNWFDNPHKNHGLPGDLHQWLSHWIFRGDTVRGTMSNKQFLTNESFHCYLPKNCQSRVLSCTGAHEIQRGTPCFDEAILADTRGIFKVDQVRATQILEQLYFVGVTEYYQESLCALHVKEQNEYPDYFDCKHEAWAAKFPQHHNTHGGEHGPVRKEVGASEVEQIRKLVDADLMIHHLGLKRLRKENSELEK